jgi:hypothetical protein
MHLAILAGLGNDALAELMLLLILWQSIHITRSGLDLQRGVVTGMTLGLAFLTKTTIYIGAAVVLVAVLLHREPGQGSWLDRAARTLGPFIGVLVVAVLFVAPWLLRNAQVYGDLDLLAWQRHDAVVAGQLRTADLIVEIGWAGLLKRFALTTFRSFWAQFGWMGVLVDERIYLSLALLSALLGLGLVLFAVRAWLGVRWPETQGRITLTETQGRALALLGISLLLSVVLYLGYNVKFVQHQGRYLFPALGPVAVAVALSVRELLRPNAARAVAVVLLLASALLVAFGVLSEGIPAWSLALLLAACGFLASVARLPARWQWLAPASLYVALIVLDLVSLYGYLVPGTEILTSG